MKANPFLASDFRIRWSALAPEDIVPAIELALERAQVAIGSIASQPLESVTFSSTFLALEAATEELSLAWGKVGHLQSVNDSAPLREAQTKMLPEVTRFYSRIHLNQELWKRLKHFAESPSARSLAGVSRRFLDETVADFVQQGADLDPVKRDRLEKLKGELAQLTQKYSENVLDATNAWQLLVDDESRLRGLPPHAKAAALRSARDKGLGSDEKPIWRFTLHMPSQEPFMTYLEDRELRRQMWEASAGVGAADPYNNEPLVKKILQLRSEKAALLGKAHFPDLVLERRMAKGGAQALAFVDDIESRARPGFLREAAELEAFKAERTGESPSPLAPWDLAWWSEQMRRQLHAFDEEKLRPYFPMDRVIDGLFEIAGRLFGLRIQKADAEVWHPDVEFFEMRDEGGRLLGAFYTDWHPRESKRGGAWMNYLITGTADSAGHRSPHLGLICGNMTPPEQGRPALLTHREVQTIFHEFGHLIHHLLGEVEIKSLNGVNVAWDFVELPSQILENWCWEREALDLFARHHESGDRIPAELFERMTAARRFRSATATMRQVAFAKMDLLLHLDPQPYVLADDIEDAVRPRVADCLIPTIPPAPTIVKRFNHLFSSPVGYAAGYYSYKWAEVLDADAFTRFSREGLFNRTVGREFVEHILSRGNAEDPGALYRRFMGRDPDLTALLKRAGLAA